MTDTDPEPPLPVWLDAALLSLPSEDAKQVVTLWLAQELLWLVWYDRQPLSELSEHHHQRAQSVRARLAATTPPAHQP